jgi:hypothetical protein
MRLFLSIFFIFLLQYAYSQCISGNCANGKGTFKYSDGAVYTGSFKNKKCDGYGKLTYASGNVYE